MLYYFPCFVDCGEINAIIICFKKSYQEDINKKGINFRLSLKYKYNLFLRATPLSLGLH